MAEYTRPCPARQPEPINIPWQRIATVITQIAVTAAAIKYLIS